MITIRKGVDRGHFDHGWLDTYHTFSFGDYRDARHNRFRSLRVLNEDRIAPGQGFGMHPHRDMEIVTYVLSGGLQHRDNMGNGSIIGPHEVQTMTAGSGVYHSEFNASQTDPVHLLQIWVLPERNGLKPVYGQKRFEPLDALGRPQILVSSDGREGSLRIHQNASVTRLFLARGDRHELAPDRSRHLWIQVIEGDLNVESNRLEAGDGAAVERLQTIGLRTEGGAHLLMFDLE